MLLLVRSQRGFNSRLRPFGCSVPVAALRQSPRARIRLRFSCPEGRTCEIPSRKPARYTGRDHSASSRQTMPVRAAGLQLAACEPGPHPAPAARRNPAQANAAGTSANAADTATAQTHAAQMRQHSAATEVPASTAEMHSAATAAEVSATATPAPPVRSRES